MENLFKIVNKKFYVGYYLPYNPVGELTDTNLDFGVMKIVPHKEYFDGKHFIYTFDKSVNGSEEEFLKNYGNPLCEATLYRSTFVVEESEDKVCLKVFYCGRHRKVGEVFFRKSTKLNYITFNKKTNIFTVGRNNEYHKKRGKGKTSVVRRNSFPVGLTTDFFYSFLNGIEDKERYNNEVIEGVNIFLSKIGAEKVNSHKDLPVSLFGCLLDKQGIKKSDNWRGYYDVFPKPTKKDYQKNGFKFVDTFMKLHNVNSEKVKKILHKVQTPCFKSIKELIKVFGKDFILQRPDEELCVVFNVKNDETPFSSPGYFDKFKKRDLINCYKTYLVCKTEDLSPHSFYDHIRFFDTLSKYEPIRWNSKTLKEFQAEHTLWSDKVDFYTKGKYNRNYSPEFVEKISKPIELKDGMVFTPVILQKSEEYVDESIHQSNCVRTYQDRPGSLIISLRKENGDRASIEYLPIIGKINVNENMKPVDFKRVQTLGRFNNTLDESWHDAIFRLDIRLKIVNKKLWGNPTAEFVTGAGSKEIKFIFKESGGLTWESVHNNDTSDYLPFYDLLDF